MRRLSFMARAFVCLGAITLLGGCANKVLVADYAEFYKKATAEAAKASSDTGGSTKEFTLQLQVTTGTTASATIPIPVVPLTFSGNLSQVATMTSKVDLNQIQSQMKSSPLTAEALPVTTYLLDPKTGTLTPTK